MELRNSFVVPAPIDEAWNVLLDAERIAPCMPGATLEKVDGDDINGTIVVRIGPITVRYRGTIRFVETDVDAHRAVLEAVAKDTKGNGTARAKITATLSPGDNQTAVDVVTDLDITGKPAQFGRGVLAEVSKKIMNQFAENLAAEIQNDRGIPETVVAESASPQHAAATRPSLILAAEATTELDVLELLKEPARRVGIPFVIGALGGMVLGWLLGRWRHGAVG